MSEEDIWIYNGKYIVDLDKETVVECAIFDGDGNEKQPVETVGEGTVAIFDVGDTDHIELSPERVRDEETKQKIIEAVKQL